MAVGFASYEIARSGLYVSERGLDTTGHNISNVNTPGYVRQQAISADKFYQNSYTKNGLLQIGLGADIQQTRQIRHTFLDNVYRQENTSLGYWGTRQKTFEDVEAILAEPMESGLQDVLNQFWDSWQELSKDPSSLTVRALVRQRGDELTQEINHLGAQLDKMQNDLNNEISAKIDEINKITSQIARLNTQILSTEIAHENANDYRDQRNSLVDKLSGLVDADVAQMQDGQLDISVGGYMLVHKDEQWDLEAGHDADSGLFYVPKLKGTNITVKVKSGALKGLLESRGEVKGTKDSVANGEVNTKADIVFAIDTSDTSEGYLDKVKNNITNYVTDLMKRGIDYNLRLVTYNGSSASPGNGVTEVGNYGSNVNDFIAGVKGLAVNPATEGNDFGQLADFLTGITDFRPDAGRFALVFTAEGIGGNETDIDSATAQGYVSELAAAGIKTSVVTDSGYFSAGDHTGPGDTEGGWDCVTNGTGGRLYDINTSDDKYGDLLQSINSDINADVNRGIAEVAPCADILPEIRKRLNALVNIMAREVNNLHRSGKTLGSDPVDGEDFFVAIDPSRPLEMGNIKLNDIFLPSNGLNYIVSSGTGASGDNSIALQIANLRNSPVMKDITGIVSIDGYYQSLISSVGNNGAAAANTAGNQQKLVDSADNSRQAIMGVSMDEEMTNMMKFKFAYDASARALNVIDDMVRTIVEKMGLVGR